MSTFVVAYSVVWLALALYVGRLGFRQRQMMSRLAALQPPRQDELPGERYAERAA